MTCVILSCLQSCIKNESTTVPKILNICCLTFYLHAEDIFRLPRFPWKTATEHSGKKTLTYLSNIWLISNVLILQFNEHLAYSCNAYKYLVMKTSLYYCYWFAQFHFSFWTFDFFKHFYSTVGVVKRCAAYAFAC